MYGVKQKERFAAAYPNPSKVVPQRNTQKQLIFASARFLSNFYIDVGSAVIFIRTHHGLLGYFRPFLIQRFFFQMDARHQI